MTDGTKKPPPIKKGEKKPTKRKTQTNPNSLANLMPPIKKGEVLNPTGRPKGRVGVNTIIDNLLARKTGEVDEDGNYVTAKQKMIKNVVDAAVDKGSLTHTDWLVTRTEGAPKQEIQHTTVHPTLHFDRLTQAERGTLLRLLKKAGYDPKEGISE